jgi:hypothetical protein
MLSVAPWRFSMALDDYVEPEVGVAVALTAAVTAAVASPKVRKVLRRGAVYGLAGMLMAYDKVSAAARTTARGAREMAASAEAAVHQEPHGTREPVAG